MIDDLSSKLAHYKLLTTYFHTINYTWPVWTVMWAAAVPYLKMSRVLMTNSPSQQLSEELDLKLPSHCVTLIPFAGSGLPRAQACIWPKVTL